MKEFDARIKSMQEYFYGKNRKKKDKSPEELMVDENFARERDRLFEYFNELLLIVWMAWWFSYFWRFG